MVFFKVCEPIAAHPLALPERAFGENEKDDAIDAVSTKLNGMSIDERMQGLYDLHGVGDTVDETPEMVAKKTEEMTRALDAIERTAPPPKTGGDAGVGEGMGYRKAVAKSPEYVNGLKIKFLRAEGYSGERAAKRMIRFFDKKLQYFGEDILVRDIRLSDLNKNENEALEKGICQVLPQRDRAGRAIFFISGVVNILYETDAVMRVMFYYAMAATGDEETQRRGCVGLYYGIGQPNLIKGRTPEFWRWWSCLPVRQVAAHHVRDNNGNLEPARWMLSKIVESRPLSRLRFHNGTNIECIYNLMTFGIPREAFPVTDDGALELSHHHKMLAALKYREEKENKLHPSSSPKSNNAEESSLILVPGPMDVMMGRGRQPRYSPGALRMHNLLDECSDAYEDGCKFEKTVIAETILKRMKNAGCRFLKAAPGGYVECDDAAARAKISHGFRTLRGKNKKNGEATRQENGTGTSNAKKRALPSK